MLVLQTLELSTLQLTSYNGVMFMHPEQVVGACQLKPTDVVADFGAGSGFVSKASARFVPKGVVYAVELQRGLVERLQHEAKESGINNLYPIWGDIEIDKGTTLADKSVDLVILSNILFQLDDKQGCVSEVNRVLKTGGRVLVIDWSESFGGLGPTVNSVFDLTKAKEVFLKKGFSILTENLPAGDHHYAIIFKKES